MKSKMTRVVLRHFTLTEVCSENVSGASKISLPDGSCYYVKPKLLPYETRRSDGRPLWAPREFSVYPLAMNGEGIPWDEANAWILSVLEEQYDFNMATYRNKVDDIQHFRNFVDSRNIDWMDFPQLKQMRPTYRYRGFLRVELEAGGIQWSTASRRMSTVIHFYRWLINSKLFIPKYEPWVEDDVYLPLTNEYGRNTVFKVKRTDVSIANKKSENPYDSCIDDGGKLRPLSKPEQAWVMEALNHCGNTEMTLIHALALCTGARIQSVLTLRKRHILTTDPHSRVHLLCGPGTGIDTKNGKRFTIEIPRWLWNSLRTYALSERATNRRKKASGGDVDDQYLFLTERCAPMYEAKAPGNVHHKRNARYVQNGQAVRMYMKDFILKYIRERYDPNFHYQFHDLRATFGMNLVDFYKSRIDAGELTYTKVLSIVQARMCHSSPSITERYLTYRETRKLFNDSQDHWEEKIEKLIEDAMRKVI